MKRAAWSRRKCAYCLTFTGQIPDSIAQLELLLQGEGASFARHHATRVAHVWPYEQPGGHTTGSQVT